MPGLRVCGVMSEPGQGGNELLFEDGGGVIALVLRDLFSARDAQTHTLKQTQGNTQCVPTHTHTHTHTLRARGHE